MVEWNRRGARRKWLDAEEGGFFASLPLPIFSPRTRPLSSPRTRPLSSSSVSTLIPAKRRSWRFAARLATAVMKIIVRWRGKWKTLWNLDETVRLTLYDSFDFSTLASYIRDFIRGYEELRRSTKSYERLTFRFVRSGLVAGFGIEINHK